MTTLYGAVTNTLYGVMRYTLPSEEYLTREYLFQNLTMPTGNTSAGTFTLSCEGMPEICVRQRGVPTMCGGGHVQIRGVSESENARRGPHHSEIARGISPYSPAQDIFNHFRRGILVVEAVFNSNEAAAWLPVLERAMQELQDYYSSRARSQHLSVVSGSVSQSRTASTPMLRSRAVRVGSPHDSARKTTYVWLLQHAHLEKHQQYLSASVSTCPGCGSTVTGPMCVPCYRWIPNAHEAFNDDMGLVFDKAASYGSDIRFSRHTSREFLQTGRVSSHLQRHDESPLMFSTCWTRLGSSGPYGLTRSYGSAFATLVAHMKGRYLPVITSNVGATGNVHTAKLLATLYREREWLATQGIRVLTSDTFGTNPKEHYHWIDSVVLLPTTWGEFYSKAAASKFTTLS